MEPHACGRFFESFETSAGTRVIETGTVTIWEPPTRLVFEWRASNFDADETTEVEVNFEASDTACCRCERSRMSPSSNADRIRKGRRQVFG
jgi:uncharacterized protein YndB with AHSA1/START domain